MIILIGGGIYEGKDTTASITVRNIVLGHEEMSVPELESTATNQGLWHKRANIYGWHVDRFAFMPKLHCSQILGIDYSDFNSHDSPNKRKYREYYAKHAQILKEVYGNDVWVQALLNKYHGKNLIVCDWRFPEEIEAIDKRGIDYIAIIVERRLTADMWAQSLGFALSGSGRYDRHITKSEFLHLIAKECPLIENDQTYIRLMGEQANIRKLKKYPNVKTIQNTVLSELDGIVRDLLVESGVN